MKCITTQTFHQSATSVYSQNGLKSHSAVDIQCGYGTDIECLLDGYVYKVLDDKRPANDGTGYWGIFMICEYKGQWYELCVGHCSEILVDVGQYVKKGQIIGKEGNKGKVFESGVEITKAMQDKGDTRGTHRHWQLRTLKKVKESNGKTPRLTAYPLSVYRDASGYAYEIPDYYNGHNGLTDLIEDILMEYKKPTENGTMEVSLEVKKSWLQILVEFLRIKEIINKKYK